MPSELAYNCHPTDGQVLLREVFLSRAQHEFLPGKKAGRDLLYSNEEGILRGVERAEKIEPVTSLFSETSMQSAN